VAHEAFALQSPRQGRMQFPRERTLPTVIARAADIAPLPTACAQYEGYACRVPARFGARDMAAIVSYDSSTVASALIKLSEDICEQCRYYEDNGLSNLSA
jgi:hypothetical protein